MQPTGQRSRIPAATRNLEQLKLDMIECGYGVMLDALHPHMLSQIKARVLEQAEGERQNGVSFHFGADQSGMPSVNGGNIDAPNQRLSNLLNKGGIFRQLLVHPLAREMATLLLGPNHLLSSLSAMIMNKGGVAQVLHSDQQYVPFSTPSPLVCNIVWMLTGFTRENGATRLVPGSHLWEPPAISVVVDEAGVQRMIQPQAETVIAEAPAGSALIFDGRIWHGAGANQTDTPRPAVFSYYCAPYLRQQENIPLSLLDEVYAELSETERAIIGFEAHSRSLGRIAPALGRTNTNWTDHAVGLMHP